MRGRLVVFGFGGAINQHMLVRNFLLAVSRGTILRDGEDPTGLRWKPSSPDRYAVRKSYLRQFLEALQDFSDEGAIITTRFCQVAVSSRAREYQRARSLLYHLGTPRTYSGKPNDSSRSLGVLHKKRGFDQDVLLKLLQVGCRRSRSMPAFYNKNGELTLASEFNLNLLMAIILMVGGGRSQSI